MRLWHTVGNKFSLDLYDDLSYIVSMKVTAIIQDELIEEVMAKTKAKNITESLKTALTEWLRMQKIKELNLQVAESPLDFKYGAEELRDLNRK